MGNPQSYITIPCALSLNVDEFDSNFLETKEKRNLIEFDVSSGRWAT